MCIALVKHSNQFLFLTIAMKMVLQFTGMSKIVNDAVVIFLNIDLDC